MLILIFEFEFVDQVFEFVCYLEYGWFMDLCCWYSYEVYELYLIIFIYGKVFVGEYIGFFGSGVFYLVGFNLFYNWVIDEVGVYELVELCDMLVQFSQ